jgi:hypothetical protein
MSPRRFRPFEREAYEQAGVAVVAHALRIPVYRLSVVGGGRLPSLPSYEEWRIGQDRSEIGLLSRTEDYVTTLLAGSVGHLILQEKCFNYRRPSTGRMHLKERRLAEARKGEGELNDRAFYLTFAWLWQADDGNADATIVRLWHNAEALLRRSTQRRQVERLAIRLLVRGELFIQEIRETFKR